MKTHHLNLFKLSALLLVCIAMFGCGKDNGRGSIYGIVTDYSTGEPVKNANVQLRPSGETTLTGYDGNYEFLNVPCGNYSLKVSKEGYSDLIDDYVIEIQDGKQTKRDVQIKRIPSSLQIYDNDSHEISELDFGANEGVTQKTFNIFNGGSQSINYEITNTAVWVLNISQSSGTINVGSTCPIVITINREKLADGLNTTTLLITSSEDGGKELVVKAKKGGSDSNLVVELPAANLMVQKEDLGTVDWNSAQLLCNNSTVAEFNDWRLPTKEELMTLYSNRSLIGGFSNERYWSSSYIYSSDDTKRPYYVDFSNGALSSDYNHYLYHVRAVRSIH